MGLDLSYQGVMEATRPPMAHQVNLQDSHIRDLWSRGKDAFCDDIQEWLTCRRLIHGTHWDILLNQSGKNFVAAFGDPRDAMLFKLIWC
jgi:hypothetical protein